jgi:hypothetical protein
MNVGIVTEAAQFLSGNFGYKKRGNVPTSTLGRGQCADSYSVSADVSDQPKHPCFTII